MGETLELKPRREHQAESLYSWEDEVTCRICFCGSEDEELVAPCECKGGSEFVHVSCLQQWRSHLMTKNLAWKALSCTVCRAPYSERVLRGHRTPKMRQSVGFGCIRIFFGFWPRVAVAPEATATPEAVARSRSPLSRTMPRRTVADRRRVFDEDDSPPATPTLTTPPATRSPPRQASTPTANPVQLGPSPPNTAVPLVNPATSSSSSSPP